MFRSGGAAWVVSRFDGLRWMAMRTFFVVLWVLVGGVSALGQSLTTIPGVYPEIRPLSYQVPVGQPVSVRFSLTNRTDAPITLQVPALRLAIPSPEAGLPISHVFSGTDMSGLTLSTSSGRRWDKPNGYRAVDEAPLLLLGGGGSVGVTLDLRDYFPALRGAGQYRFTWSPYAGTVGTVTAVVTIAPLQQVEIVTDAGPITIRLFYSDAPLTVENFIELAESGFYTAKTFHRLEPGYIIQGGCHRGDGTGIRPDGKRVLPEFNGHPMRKGSVAMALLEDDPESASSQFFICNTRQKEWDGRYTIFGELVGEASFETLDKLMASPVDEYGYPLKPLHMHTVRITKAPVDQQP